MSSSDPNVATEAHVIVGTAGHVDHGKSSLVLALTGTDPDRLPQEKARGITIDLGFAELTLPSGRSVGVVDVPGHEHYVRAMVAGAAGVDVALLVIAADDGVMPQTREHLHILEIMGARQMVVALTKSDLVDADWLELVQLDVEEFLAGTRFAGAPVVPVSSRTRAGLPELLAELDRAVDAFVASGVPQDRLARPARLSVDRSFNVAGAGAVVTGTLRHGCLHPGDAVEVMPAGAKARVRGVQTHGRDVPCAFAGQRTALNLTGVGLDDLPRGATVCAPGSLAARDRFDARLRWMGRAGEDPAPLVSGERFHVCVGTSQALGRILLFDGAQQLAAGEEALVQVRLEEPLVLAAHDRFVAMAYSPVELVGGGEVLWGDAPRRSTPSEPERALLAAVEAGDARAALAAYGGASRSPVDAAGASASLDLPVEQVRDALGELAQAGELVALGEGAEARYLTPAAVDACVAACAASLRDAAQADAGFAGMSAAALRDAAVPRADMDAFAALVELAVARGEVARLGALLAHAQDADRLRRAAGDLADTVAAALDAHGVAAPFVEELAGELGMAEPQVRRGLTMLVDAGRAVAVDKGYALGTAAFEQAKGIVRAAVERGGGQASASELREALGLSRKYALPLLECMDRQGVTERTPDGQGRRLR